MSSFGKNFYLSKDNNNNLKNYPSAQNYFEHKYQSSNTGIFWTKEENELWSNIFMPNNLIPPTANTTVSNPNFSSGNLGDVSSGGFNLSSKKLMIAGIFCIILMVIYKR